MASRRAARTNQILKTTGKRSAQDIASSSPKRVKAPTAKAADSLQKELSRRKLPIREPILTPTPTVRLEVFVCGDGSSGELGLGSKDSLEVKRPRLNHNLDPRSVGVVSLAAGGMHAVALTHDNRLLTWGVNDLSALGRDTTWDGGMREIDAETDSNSDASEPDLNPRESTPTAIPVDNFLAGTRFVQVIAGDSATFALTDAGLVYGWGTFRDSKGVFGFYLKTDGEIIKLQKDPMLIPDLNNIVQLSAGSDFCLALDVAGTVFAWGSGEQSQLGRRLVERRRMTALRPTRVALPKTKIVSIYTGSDHAFAIDSDGNTWAWGSNNFGQTGIASGAGLGGSTVIAPEKVSALVNKRMKMIQGGLHHSVGIAEGGECFVWGRMDGRQMGLDFNTLPLGDPSQVVLENGRPRILLQPTRLPLVGCTYAAAGTDHNIAIDSEGNAYSWGFNVSCQCGQGSGNEDISIATLIKCPSINGKKLCWAGAGGQYSMLASTWEGVGALTNGIHTA